ncbi:MAG: chorismate synthase [Methanocellales archaeon]
MSGNTFGKIFKVTTWGESHGRAVGAVVDGCPAGLELSEIDIEKELYRRRPGQSKIATQRRELDEVEILSGVFQGKTTGTPISMLIWNRDVDSRPYELIKDTPRPGHADLTYELKYGFRDYRGGGRASARETVGRVAAGAIAKKLLSLKNIEILGHVVAIGPIKVGKVTIDQIRENAEKNEVRCADPTIANVMIQRIMEIAATGDSIGGVAEIIATGVPPGLGEPVFDKLEADLAKALMSIGAVRGFEIGAGFKSAEMRGSEMNDAIMIKNGKITFASNNAGGVLGGISTGQEIVCRIAVKPTPSIAKEQCTINIKTMEETKIKVLGKHDPCILPRIVPVAEAMVAIVLADHALRSGLIPSCRII